MISSGRLSDKKRQPDEFNCFWYKEDKVSKEFAKEAVYNESNVVCRACRECIDGVG